MKKILIFLMAIVTLAVTSPAFATKRSIMELPLFERAVLIIKKFETLHQLKHRPYYGYGHRILPGERFPQHRPMTESEADALLRKDLKKICVMYSEYGKDSVLLGTLAYNIGPGAVNKSIVIKKTESRQPRHIQSLHLPLPLQRQMAQRLIQSQAHRACGSL